MIAPEITAAYMAIVGIIINIILTQYLTSSGKKIDSPALLADGQHQKVDIFSGIAILLGVLGSQIGYPILDPLVAIVIAVIVIKTAFELGRDNVNILMGKLPSKDIIFEIESTAMLIHDVKGIHSVKINPMGPYSSAELHIELNGDLKLNEAHKIAHNVEKLILKNVSSIKMATIHVCPYDEECEPLINKNNHNV